MTQKQKDLMKHETSRLEYKITEVSDAIGLQMKELTDKRIVKLETDLKGAL
jgi:hypothetical protein